MKMDTMEAGRRASKRGARNSSTRSNTKSQGRARTRTRTKALARTSTRGGTRTTGRSQRQRRAGSGSAQATTDLNEIRSWAEARGGKPVSVKGTARSGAAGLLRIDFPGYTGAGRFEEISWEEWYDKFRESNLEFLYQDRAGNGGQSRFFKLVNRGTSNSGRGSSRSSSRRRTTRPGAKSAARSSSKGRSRSR
jgi:hypothetical protein